jgi:PAS domain S-box-containing protein
MGTRMRAFDWSQSPVGPPSCWPETLRISVNICLGSRHPIFIWWGRDTLTQFYNDGYIPMLGLAKHPRFLGGSARDCWSEIWPIIQPMVAGVFETGKATWSEDFLLVLHRSLPREEGFFTFSYSPIPDAAGQVGGIFCAVTETTGRVIGERRLRTLRDLGQTVMQAASAEEACKDAARTLSGNPADVPFALIYLVAPGSANAHLVAMCGLDAASRAAPPSIALTGKGEGDEARGTWPLSRCIAAGGAVRVEDAGARFEVLPGGPWPERSEAALIVPIAATGQSHPVGFLVAGLSPRRTFDEAYGDFFKLIGGHIAAAIANAETLEQEKRRVEALAEIDRAKTTFFSNVSHEFRTPLTLMLGPIEDALADATASPAIRERLDLAHRNSLRLLKLVNTLLDFARIEAGRVEPHFGPTDLARVTAEIASIFRSAVERAGMTLTIRCEPLEEQVFVDRDMWEKIVLNLLSNAFKFTLNGGITVALSRVGGRAELRVADTGVGIPAEELPLLFQRFHRVEGARGRTHEGTGIGLALVQELMKIHGGSIRAESVLGQGSTFVAQIPFGKDHLAESGLEAERSFAPTSVHAGSFVEEALRWLPGTSVGDSLSLADSPAESGPKAEAIAGTRGARIVLAEDNADLREYLLRLLQPNWAVEAVADGRAALAAVRREKPDLVLSDVMMPQLDGFGLLEAMRTDAELKEVPIVLLSARAGEEARVEGMTAGADDYLVKPFAARELLARVGGVLSLAKVRRQASESVRLSEARFRAFVTSSSNIIYSMNPDWSEMRYLNGRDFIADTDQPTRSWLEKYVDPRDRPRVLEAVQRAIRTRTPFELEHRVLRLDGTPGWTHSRAVPILGATGAITEWFGTATDVTARRSADEALRHHGEQFATLINRAPMGIFVVDAGFRIQQVNPVARPVFGDLSGSITGREFEEVLHQLWEKDYADELVDIFRRTLESGESYVAPERTESRLNQSRKEYYEWRVDRIALADGGFGLVCYFRDITEQVQSRKERERLLAREQKARREAEDANRLKDEFLANLSHELRTPLSAILGWSHFLEQSPDPETVTEAVSVIVRNARAQTQIIEDLLDMSRILSGKFRLDVKPVNVSEVVAAAVESVTPSANTKSLRLRSILDPKGGPVSGDPARLQQVVWNLLSNALKFTPKGGQIQVTVERVNSHVDVTVSDTGRGIPPEFLPHIFERFRQADSSTTRAHGGLGIGLSLVKQIVELHAGSVTASSAGPGQGATFVVSLPLSIALPAQPGDSAARSGDPEKIERPVVLEGLKVLFVDDDPDGRAMGRRILSDHHAEVMLAASADEALELVRKTRPDVLVSDIGMPGADGYDLIRRVRQLPDAEGGGVPAVALTAFARSEDRRRVLLAGYEAHVAKPVVPEELVAVVASVAGKVRRPPSARA